MSQDSPLGFFERGDGLFAGHGGEVFQEVFERLVSFQTVDEILEGDSCSDEDRSSTKDFGVAVDDGSLAHDAFSRLSKLKNTTSPFGASPQGSAARPAQLMMAPFSRPWMSPLCESSWTKPATQETNWP